VTHCATPSRMARSRPTGTIGLLLLLSRTAGRPCPSDQAIASACSVPIDQVEAFIQGVADRGIIEIEQRGEGERRMRVQSAAWSAWAAGDEREGEDRPAAGDAPQRAS